MRIAALRSFGLKKTQKILKRPEFIRLSQSGKKLQDSCFIVIYTKGDGPTRFGITVSKRVGNAVVRNRVKRLVREWFRLHRANWNGCWNLNVIAKKKAAELSLQGVELSLEKIIDQVGGSDN
ncbi:MAG: ribonuclease P protein component [Desulfosalsimonadaceae bacterium]